MIIEKNKILAVRCILPLSENRDLPPSLGLRHRAALGITERTDAVSVVVSEETGKISVAVSGQLRQGISRNELIQFLEQELSPAR
jgi:DNA integrity scanning protein DisA with diadenylate cyclase activity